MFSKQGSQKSRASRIIDIALPVGFAILFFVLWQTQVLHKILNTDVFTLPLPTRILQIINDNQEKIWLNTKATVSVSLLGLFAGSVLGYLIAVIATIFPKAGVGGLSIVSIFNAVPIVALAPVVTNWTRDFSDVASERSMFAKVIVVMVVCTAAMSINVYRGLTELKPFSEDLMKSYATPKLTVFLKLRFPNSLPFIFTALKVSVPASVISALVSEYFAEYIIGVGRQIRENIVLAQYSTAWAYIAVACIIGMTMYGILLLVENIMLKNRR